MRQIADDVRFIAVFLKALIVLWVVSVVLVLFSAWLAPAFLGGLMMASP